MDRSTLLREAATSFDDDNALLVLADRLQLANESIGELMVHQCVASSTVTQRRLAELETEACSRWLGPLDRVVDLEEVSFRRGLPSRLVLQRNAPTLMVPDPMWELVETLDLNGTEHPDLPQLLPRLVRLRRLEGVLPDAVTILSGPLRPVSLESLGCYLGSRRTKAGRFVPGGDLLPEAVELLAASGLRELRHGDTYRADSYGWLWRSELGARLERLSVSNMTRDLVVRGRLAILEWTSELRAHASPRLACFELTDHERADFLAGGWTVRLERKPGGFAIHASFKASRAYGWEPLARLVLGIGELPRGTISSFVLEPLPRKVRASADWARLERELARLECSIDLR